MAGEEQAKKRGWIFDQLMIVGQLEAGMNHNDEEICNITTEMEDHPDDLGFLEGKANELNANVEIIELDYENRVDTLNQVFDAVPGSNRHYYCQIKHRAAAFVQAAENYHARGCSEEAEQTLVRIGKTLALTCSLAFGFEPFSCLRCLDEAIQKKGVTETHQLFEVALADDKAPYKAVNSSLDEMNKALNAKTIENTQEEPAL